MKGSQRLAKLILLFLLPLQPLLAQEALPVLANKAANLKQEILDLNKDMFILEEELLFPANTQFTVFLSMDADTLFALDSVQLRVDDKILANHLYTEREVQALQHGGVQRLYIGNVAAGEHELTAFFTGIGPNKRDYKRGTTLKIEKTLNPQFVELMISGNTSKQQPEFKNRVWE